MRDRLRNLSVWTLLWLLPAALALAVVRLEGDVLYRAQELSLFLTTRHFFSTQAVYPGGPLSWLGCLATTVFYSRAWTFVMLSVLWGLCAVLVGRLFRLRGWWRLMGVALPLALAACLTQTGYWLYCQKLSGHMMVPTLGVLLALLIALFGLTLRRRSPWLCVVWMILSASAGYPLMGAYSFLATALMVWPGEWRRDGWASRMVVPTVAAGLLIAVVPWVYYHVYSQVELSQIYCAAMPTFGIDSNDFPQYRLPYYGIMLSLVPAMLCALKPERFLPKHWHAAAISLLVLAAALVGLRRVWYTDANFHREIRQSLAIERQDWEGVLRIARERTDEMPTRIMVLNRNLALFRLGRAGDEVFHYREGDALPNAPWPVSISRVNGRQLYYHYGLENFCYRWCMEQGIETGWSVDGLRLMAKASLLNGEYDVARKYLGLLKHTLHHRAWAEHYETYLNHPELIRQDAEMEPITHLMEGDNHLDTDNMHVENYLVNTFSTSTGSDPLRQELNLLFAMLSRDIPTFWQRFFEYVPTHAQQHMPLHFQEAAYLYGQLEHTVDTSHMPFDDEVRRTYAEFMQFNEQCGTMTLEQKKKAFYPAYGKTFYYYYFLVRGLTTL